MPKKIPERRCAACRRHAPKPELARVVRSPSGEVTYDPRGKSPGRGAYICKSAACLERAVKTKALARALQTEISADIYETLRMQMKEAGDG